MAAKTISFETSKNPCVYEINTRAWLYSLQQRYPLKEGSRSFTLRCVPDCELRRIAGYGMTHVWLMGVWAIGSLGGDLDRRHSSAVWTESLPDCTEADVIGSPYAITEYVMNPGVAEGGDEELQHFRERLARLGVGLMLDFVSNHTARDSPWVQQEQTQRGMFYIRGEFDEICSGHKEWKDTYQLNYWSPSCRQFMATQLARVAGLCDAVRCDMAHLLLNDEFEGTRGADLKGKFPRPAVEWWPETIAMIRRSHPRVLFVAEAYGSAHEAAMLTQGFDFTYHKEVYDELVGDRDNYYIPHLDRLRQHTVAPAVAALCHRGVHFTENHDEPRAVGDALGTVRRAYAASVIASTLPGMRLFYYGQFRNYAQLKVQLRRCECDTSFFYMHFLPILQHPVFHQGQWQSCSVKGGSAWRFLAWSWSLGSERRLVCVNYTGDGGHSPAHVLLPNFVPITGASADVSEFHELITDKVYAHSTAGIRKEGLLIVLPPWGYQIFSY